MTPFLLPFTPPAAYGVNPDVDQLKTAVAVAAEVTMLTAGIVVLAAFVKICIDHANRAEPSGRARFIITVSLIPIIVSLITLMINGTTTLDDFVPYIEGTGWVLLTALMCGAIYFIAVHLPRFLLFRRNKISWVAKQEEIVAAEAALLERTKLAADMTALRSTLPPDERPWLDKQAELAGFQLTISSGTYEWCADDLD